MHHRINGRARIVLLLDRLRLLSDVRMCILLLRLLRTTGSVLHILLAWSDSHLLHLRHLSSYLAWLLDHLHVVLLRVARIRLVEGILLLSCSTRRLLLPLLRLPVLSVLKIGIVTHLLLELLLLLVLLVLRIHRVEVLVHLLVIRLDSHLLLLLLLHSLSGLVLIYLDLLLLHGIDVLHERLLVVLLLLDGSLRLSLCLLLIL